MFDKLLLVLNVLLNYFANMPEGLAVCNPLDVNGPVGRHYDHLLHDQNVIAIPVHFVNRFLNCQKKFPGFVRNPRLLVGHHLSSFLLNFIPQTLLEFVFIEIGNGCSRSFPFREYFELVVWQGNVYHMNVVKGFIFVTGCRFDEKNFFWFECHDLALDDGMAGLSGSGPFGIGGLVDASDGRANGDPRLHSVRRDLHRFRSLRGLH